MHGDEVLVHFHLYGQYNVQFIRVIAPLVDQMHHKTLAITSELQAERLLKSRKPPQQTQANQCEHA